MRLSSTSLFLFIVNISITIHGSFLLSLSNQRSLQITAPTFSNNDNKLTIHKGYLDDISKDQYQHYSTPDIEKDSAANFSQIRYTKEKSISEMKGLVTSSKLSLRVADEIATKAIEIAIASVFDPISVCVMDPSGHAIVTKRMDDCPPIAYPKISFAKANTCVSTKSSSRAYGMKYLSGKNCEPVAPDVFARVLNQISIMDGKMAAFQGGVLIRESGNGEVVGSIGVSGAAGDEDEYCALRAVKECSIGDSLITEPSDHSCNTVRSHL